MLAAANTHRGPVRRCTDCGTPVEVGRAGVWTADVVRCAGCHRSGSNDNTPDRIPSTRYQEQLDDRQPEDGDERRTDVSHPTTRCAYCRRFLEDDDIGARGPALRHTFAVVYNSGATGTDTVDGFFAADASREMWNRANRAGAVIGTWTLTGSAPLIRCLDCYDEEVLVGTPSGAKAFEVVVTVGQFRAHQDPMVVRADTAAVAERWARRLTRAAYPFERRVHIAKSRELASEMVGECDDCQGTGITGTDETEHRCTICLGTGAIEFPPEEPPDGVPRAYQITVKRIGRPEQFTAVWRTVLNSTWVRASAALLGQEKFGPGVCVTAVSEIPPMRVVACRRCVAEGYAKDCGECHGSRMIVDDRITMGTLVGCDACEASGGQMENHGVGYRSELVSCDKCGGTGEIPMSEYLGALPPTLAPVPEGR